MNNYLIIVCGNYETKIMVGMIEDSNVRVLYVNEFLTNDVIENSILNNQKNFKSKLFQKINQIKDLIGFIPDQVILNIPAKDIDTISSTSPEYKLNNHLTHEVWKKISNNLKLSDSQLKDNYLLGKKIFYWELDGNGYRDVPFNVEGTNLLFKTQFYTTSKKNVLPFLEVFKDLGIKINQVVVDPMIIPEGFHENLRNNKAFINIGHDKSNLFYYKNSSLNKKEIIHFGLKNLTHEISKKTGVSEIDAIKFLKVYKNISSFEEVDVPFKVTILKEIGKYKTFKYRDINILIKEWLNELTNQINKFYFELEKKNEEIDEIYLLSASNIFEKWVHHIKAKLNLKVDVFYINDSNIKFDKNSVEIIGLHEPKYISLIYSLFYIHKQLMLY
ncbi:MAG: hypothetical protein ACRCVI_00170 [Mycoplasmoidaceae bacterium]